jgi:hypothetical protein
MSGESRGSSGDWVYDLGVCKGLMVRTQMGGVNHSSSHCRLAKLCGLMIDIDYGAVIGRETRIFVCAQLQLPGYGFF